MRSRPAARSEAVPSKIGTPDSAPEIRFQERGQPHERTSLHDGQPRPPSLSIGESSATDPSPHENEPMEELLATLASNPDFARLDGIKKLHFIGIGGVGMSGIAQMCLEQGFSVSGSDAKESEMTRK